MPSLCATEKKIHKRACSVNLTFLEKKRLINKLFKKNFVSMQQGFGYNQPGRKFPEDNAYKYSLAYSNS